MIGSPLAKRYATALFDLADEQKSVPKVAADLQAVATVWAGNETLRAVFANPQFGVEEKRGVAQTIATRLGAHTIVKNTLSMLSDRRRLAHIEEISEVFGRIAEQRSGRIRAEVVSAGKLPESYFAKLQKTLEASTGKQVVLVRSEDPTLIGGVVTTIDGRVFDGSLKNRLRELRSQLLSSSDPASTHS